MGDGEGEVLDDTSPVCVFKPGVQVLDNWGWCNGSCVRSYNESESGILTSVGNQLSGCYENTGIYYQGTLDGTVRQCSGQRDYPNTNSWLKYNGAIIIIP